MGARLSQQQAAITVVIFLLSVLVVYMCTREAYRQVDVAHEMDAALSLSEEDEATPQCLLTSGPAHKALSALTGDDIRLWCDARDGSCAIWTGGKVIDARCALGARRQKPQKLPL